MIGVDTAVVVSLFVNDNPAHHAAAKALFRQRHEEGPVFICSTVLLEAVRTMKTLYGYEDDAMKRMLLSLCSLPNTVVEHMDTVFAYATDEETDIDLAEILIAAANRKNGCAAMLTFDKRIAGGVPGMELLT